MKDYIVKFKVGETYSVRSIGDHNAVWYYRIVKRTAKSVWLKEGRSPQWLDSLTTEQRSHDMKRKKIDVFQGVETCRPEGSYSFAPILKADSKCYVGDPAAEGIRAAKEDARKEKANEPEQGKQYRLTGATGTPCIANGNSWEESKVKSEPRTVEIKFDMTWSQLIQPMLDAYTDGGGTADAKSCLIHKEFLHLAKIADHAKTLQDENKKLREELREEAK